MKKGNKKILHSAIALLTAFVVWTMAVKLFDVKAIGPEGTTVGFATINEFIHNLTGVNMHLYTITDYLSIVPLFFITGFALTGLIQLIKRKSLRSVDFDILVLGVFYIIVMAVYVFFEIFVVNYRPLLIDGQLEASYPSSTTTLVMTVMPSSTMQLSSRIKNKALNKAICALISVFTAFMVFVRLFSGVHWLSDIIGGALLSAGLVLLYRFASLKK